MLVRDPAVAFVAVCAMFSWWSAPTFGQSLEETILVLMRSGAESAIAKHEPGILLVDDLKWEVRVLDRTNCIVRITHRDWTSTIPRRDFWDDEPKGEQPNLNATHQEYFLNRVVAAEIKKLPEVEETVRGKVSRERPDAKWVLPGNYGDELRCMNWPDGTRTCWDKVEFQRTLPTGVDVPDKGERTARVDRAITHLYGDLCKGTRRKTPF